MGEVNEPRDVARVPVEGSFTTPEATRDPGESLRELDGVLKDLAGHVKGTARTIDRLRLLVSRLTGARRP